ncbi:MAG: hypothetical protein ACTSRI_04415 [Promethearchaeota archaeon]
MKNQDLLRKGKYELSKSKEYKKEELKKDYTPKFAWIVLVCLGCLDLLRGFMHTVLLESSAENIMGLDLTVARNDQLFTLGVFGISNYLTGIIFILIGLKARNIVPHVLLAIPFSYFFGLILIRRVTTPTAKLGGSTMMSIYLMICIITFISTFIVKALKRRKEFQ